jgi:hypothetical protein
MAKKKAKKKPAKRKTFLQRVREKDQLAADRVEAAAADAEETVAGCLTGITQVVPEFKNTPTNQRAVAAILSAAYFACAELAQDVGTQELSPGHRGPVLRLATAFMVESGGLRQHLDVLNKEC